MQRGALLQMPQREEPPQQASSSALSMVALIILAVVVGGIALYNNRAQPQSEAPAANNQEQQQPQGTSGSMTVPLEDEAYKVQPRDTLSAIALDKCGDSSTSVVDQIVAANPATIVDSHWIYWKGKRSTIMIPGWCAITKSFAVIRGSVRHSHRARARAKATRTPLVMSAVPQEAVQSPAIPLAPEVLAVMEKNPAVFPAPTEKSACLALLNIADVEQCQTFLNVGAVLADPVMSQKVGLIVFLTKPYDGD